MYIGTTVVKDFISDFYLFIIKCLFLKMDPPQVYFFLFRLLNYQKTIYKHILINIILIEMYRMKNEEILAI